MNRHYTRQSLGMQDSIPKKRIKALEIRERLTTVEAAMNNPEYTYRCPKKCPIGKHCFVIKVTEAIKEPMTVLQKCPDRKTDIRIIIGGPRPP